MGHNAPAPQIWGLQGTGKLRSVHSKRFEGSKNVDQGHRLGRKRP